MEKMLIDASTIPGWRKSSLSGPNCDNCVEVTTYRDQIAVRNSTNPRGPAVLFTTGEWDAFVGGVKNGEFDNPLGASS